VPRNPLDDAVSAEALLLPMLLVRAVRAATSAALGRSLSVSFAPLRYVRAARDMTRRAGAAAGRSAFLTWGQRAG